MNRQDDFSWRRGGQQRRRFLAGVAVRFLLLFPLVLALIALGYLLLDFGRFDAQRATLRAQEGAFVEAATRIWREDIAQWVDRSRVQADSDAMRRFLRGQDPASRAALESEFRSIVRHLDALHYVAVVGPDGRVLAMAGDTAPTRDPRLPVAAAQAVPPLPAAWALSPGQVYLSGFYAATRPGETRASTGPMLVATPLYDGQSRPIALLVHKYDTQRLVRHFQTATTGAWGQPLMMSAEGELLVSGLPTATGEVTAVGTNAAFAFPLAWAAMRERREGAVMAPAGYLTFSTLDARDLGVVSSSDQAGWKFATFVPAARYRYAPPKFLPSPSLIAFLVGAAALLSLVLAWLLSANRAYTRALQNSQNRLHLALAGARMGLWDWDLQRDRIYFSQEWAALLGYNAEDLSNDPREWRNRLHPDERDAVLERMRQQLASPGRACDVRCRMRHRDGHYVWLEHRGSPIFGALGQPQRLICTAMDVTDQVRVEQELRQAAAVFEGVNEAIFVVDDRLRITAVNPAFTEITGYAAEDVIGRHPRYLQAGHGRDLYAAAAATLAGSGHWRGEVWERRKNGEEYPVWQNISAVRDDRGEIRQYVVVMTDISVIKRSEAKLAYLAHHDTLTGLPNRLLLLQTLEQALARAGRHNRRLALLFLDLDRFKLINDTLGHEAGDELLKVVANRLQASVRGEDTVARLGGDEFTVLLEDVDEPEDAVPAAHKIIDTLAEPLLLSGQTISTSTSIGIALYPDDATTPAELLKAADVAMYQAKQLGRHNYQFFTRELAARAASHLVIEQGLRRALRKGELTLHFQPQVCLNSGRVVGMEALIRWRHPKQGLLLPAQFLPVAEESGLIEPIGEWVIEQVCERAKEWHRDGLPRVRMALNLTLRQLRSEPLRRHMEAVIGAARPTLEDVPLELEIAEGAIQAAMESVERLGTLRALGVGLALDDFGTGYSSLSMLSHLPVDMLKIHGSFLRRDHQDAAADAIADVVAESVVALGRTLHMRVLAEGVETDGQLAFLQKVGCDEAQGNLFSQPLEAEPAAELIARQVNLLERRTAI